MRLIYHRQSGKLSGKNPEDDYHVVLGGKEYHIIITRFDVIVINEHGERLYMDRGK